MDVVVEQAEALDVLTDLLLVHLGAGERDRVTRLRERVCELEQQGRLARAGRARDDVRVAEHEAAAEHLVDARHARALVVDGGRDLRRGRARDLLTLDAARLRIIKPIAIRAGPYPALVGLVVTHAPVSSRAAVGDRHARSCTTRSCGLAFESSAAKEADLEHEPADEHDERDAAEVEAHVIAQLGTSEIGTSLSLGCSGLLCFFHQRPAKYPMPTAAAPMTSFAASGESRNGT